MLNPLDFLCYGHCRDNAKCPYLKGVHFSENEIASSMTSSLKFIESSKHVVWLTLQCKCI